MNMIMIFSPPIPAKRKKRNSTNVTFPIFLWLIIFSPNIFLLWLMKSALPAEQIFRLKNSDSKAMLSWPKISSISNRHLGKSSLIDKNSFSKNFLVISWNNQESKRFPELLHNTYGFYVMCLGEHIYWLDHFESEALLQQQFHISFHSDGITWDIEELEICLFF